MSSRLWLRLILLVAAIIGLTLYVAFNPEVVQRSLAFGWLNVAVLAVSYVVAQYLNAWILKAGLEPPYRGIAVNDAIGINMVSSLAGYLTPLRLGGMGSRLMILRMKYGVEPGFAVGQFLLVTLMTIGLSAAFFAFSVLVHGGEVSLRYGVAAAFMAAIAAGMVVLCALLADKRSYSLLSPRLPRLLVGVHEAIARPWKSQVKITLLLVVSFGLQVLQTQWLLHAVGMPGDVFFSTLVCALANLMLVLTLTPGNLGIKEGLLGSLAFVFLIDEKAFVGALLVDRFVQLGVLMVGSVLYSSWGDGSNRKY
ncbi:lysylphosphatidylglycerol synthase transmembrane domain-containing protein [Lysobacter capsici]|uniref:lysylphosphatidylglycerol synthase transmembrane domain-containing protein n=1 Tax=Lysobacter capsici TaxID=435897 RepID=UPI001C002609|nr:lysylphosphatidylglycerol synthase transmembrane domain-containing protein [Lysobacter capsici]QWF16041.1 flippase-like domain-containing protein [Lysobacter capsici]